MKKIKVLAIASAVSVGLIGSVANAAIVSLENVTAEWYEAGPTSVTYGGTSVAPTVRWGDSNGFSGYDFTLSSGISFEVPPSPSPTKVIGEFNHVNFPITAGTGISSAKLRITADINIDGGLVGNRVFEYFFDHWETPNGDNPCADGGTNNTGVNVNGCADRVKINWLSSSDSFNLNGDIYTLNILGFSASPDGLNPFTEFWTVERDNNNAFLVGNVTLRSDVAVPEPGTLALMGLGMLGMGMARRRRNA